MKKLMSILTALTTLTALAVSGADAVNFSLPELDSLPIEEAQSESDSKIPYVYCDDEKESNGMKKAGNPDLKALAKSLGADKGYFYFANYIAPVMSDEVYSKYRKNNNKLEAVECLSNVQDNFLGVCYGMSCLEILVHNGVIPLSALDDKAETLYDIDYSDYINDCIAYYQLTQDLRFQETTMKYYFCQTRSNDMVKNLLATAEKSMKENKWFLINIDGYLNDVYGAHAICGLGITDGSWSYNGKKYDKCILTLDSNAVTNPDDKDCWTNAGFKERACIYVNSKTYDFYIPGYNFGNDEYDFISFVCGDDDFINYQGLFNPSSSAKTDNSDAVRFQMLNYAYTYDLTVKNNGQSKTLNMKPREDFRGFANNFYYPMSTGACCETYLDCDSLKIHTQSIDEDLVMNKPYMRATFGNKNALWDVTAFNAFDLTVDEKKVSFTNTSETKPESTFMLAEYFNAQDNCKPEFNYFVIDGNYKGTVSAYNCTDGVIIESDKGFESKISAVETIIDETGAYKFTREYYKNYFGLSSVGNVKIQYDRNDNKFNFYIGKNYDKLVEKGDVNCDGTINAIDASVILSGYSELATSKPTPQGIEKICFVNKYLGDFNSDGNLDAIDASKVLAYYVDKQVK